MHGSAPSSVPKLSLAAKLIVEGARKQLEHPAKYDASYRSIGYPGGDVPTGLGACTDVVIRALRHAGFDLQELIHQDYVRANYPSGKAKADANIDHRRVKNQAYFFSRNGASLPISLSASASASWQPGDFVYWKLPSGLDHIGVLTDRRGGSGNWVVVHNLELVREEDVLPKWTIIGHYRYPKPRQPNAR